MLKKFVVVLLFTIPFQGFAQHQKTKKKSTTRVETFSTSMEYFDHGSDLLQKKKYTQAMKYLDKAIEMDKTMYEAFYNRGICKYYLQDYPAAIPDFSRSIKLYKKPFHDGLYFRGRCYTQMGQYELAVSDFSKALDIASNADLWSARGFAFLHLMNYEAALTDFTYAIALDKSRIENYGSRAVCNYNLHHLNEAIADAEVFLAQNPNSADIIEFEMRSKFELKDYTGADSLVKKLVQLRQTNLTYYYKGMVEYYLQKFDDGIYDFTLSLKMDSSFRDAWYARALSYLALNDDTHACPDLRQARKMGYPGLDNKIEGYCKDIKQ